MRINKRFTGLVAVLIVAALVASMTVGLAAAQDDGDAVVCDWTLITLLYIAEYEYGYIPMTDVSNFDFGQYTPLFEAMMAEMMEMEPTEEPEMMETEEPEMEATEESPYTQLAHGDIEGEPQACTDLRHELDAYFLSHFMHDVEMGE